MINNYFEGNCEWMNELELIRRDKLQDAQFLKKNYFSLFPLSSIFLSIYCLYFTIISFRYIFLLLGIGVISFQEIHWVTESFICRTTSLITSCCALIQQSKQTSLCFHKKLYFNVLLYHIFIILLIFKFDIVLSFKIFKKSIS